jgi:nucleotide-binding universal stress UspA family protein
MRILSRILVATDLSPAGHAAVARAGQLAQQHDSELHMIHATPDWPLFSSSVNARQEHYDGVTRNAGALIDRETNWLLSEFGVHARAEVHRGQASRTIVRAVEAYQPDLLIIGASGEHASQTAALGGTTLKLLGQVNQPLLLVRNPKPTAYNNSLAAVQEAGALSRRIVHWGSTLAHAGTCEVVCAYDVPYIERLRLCDLSDATITARSEDQKKSVQAAIGALLCAEEAATQTHAHVVRGVALSVILAEITRYGSQVLIVGRHEHRPDGAGHALMGCVGVRLAYHAPCDVLIVP